MPYSADDDPGEAHVPNLESYKAPEWPPDAELNRDFDLSGAAATFPAEWAPASEVEAIVTMVFLWAAVHHPDFVAPLLGKRSQAEDPPSGPAELEQPSPELPAPWRELGRWALQNRDAALKLALTMRRHLLARWALRARRAHHVPPICGPVPAVLASQRIRMHLVSQPTHAP